MDIWRGVQYNIRGLVFGLKNGRLLFWGLARFVLFVLIALILAGLIFVFHREILNIIWEKPDGSWLIWLWYALSWFISLFLIGISALLSYLISQILFSAIIMDQMSRITERAVTGSIKEPERMPFLKLSVYLVKQEIPRAVIPIFLSLLLLILGWVVMFGPVFTILSSGLAIIFLAWDNTDIIPARRLLPFKARFRSLLGEIPFHIGFGLPFLIPGLNLLFLSFAPVGATLFHLDRYDNPSE